MIARGCHTTRATQPGLRCASLFASPPSTPGPLRVSNQALPETLCTSTRPSRLSCLRSVPPAWLAASFATSTKTHHAVISIGIYPVMSTCSRPPSREAGGHFFIRFARAHGTCYKGLATRDLLHSTYCASIGTYLLHTTYARAKVGTYGSPAHDETTRRAKSNTLPESLAPDCPRGKDCVTHSWIHGPRLPSLDKVPGRTLAPAGIKVSLLVTWTRPSAKLNAGALGGLQGSRCAHGAPQHLVVVPASLASSTAL